MIRQDEVFPIGTINKPHGVAGEMSFTFTTDVFDTAGAEFFIFERDGLLVPFYIESYRFRTDTTALLKLDGVDTEEQAREFAGLAVYLPVSYLDRMDEAGLTLDYFVGFTLTDERAGVLGIVTAVDDSTANVLFVVDRDGSELLVPANDDLITHIDTAAKTIRMCLPEGLA